MCEPLLTLDELAVALMEMVDEKSLGLDAFQCKFLRVAYEFVGPDHLQVYKEASRKQSLGAYTNKDSIRFIPKPEHPGCITN